MGISKKTTVTDSVYEAVLSGVVDGGYPVGSRLPSEQDLCESFGASRPIVREALARLRAEGIIKSRKGSGSYVIRKSSSPTPMSENVASMAEIDKCYDFRISLEGECAYYAALNHNDDDANALTDAFEAFRSALQDNERGGINDDFLFHLAIAEATHNTFFVSAFQAIRSRVHTAIDISRRLIASPFEVRRKMLINEHRSILVAILANDPARARREMRRHITNSKNRVFKGESR